RGGSMKTASVTAPPRRRATRRCVCTALALCAAMALLTTLGAGAPKRPSSSTGGERPSGSHVRIEVDATDAPMHLLHSRIVLPVKPGTIRLTYPKWIPGEHGPTGPIADVAGLKLKAGGETLRWSRDLEDMYAIHCEVPSGASTLEATFDFLLPPSTEEGFSSASSATAALMILSWNQ